LKFHNENCWYIVSGDADNTIKLWDVNKPNNPLRTVKDPQDEVNKPNKPLQTVKDHKKQVWSIAISEDGKYILSGDAKGKIKLWDIHWDENKENITNITFSKTFNGHNNEAVKSIAISEDSKQFVSGSDDKSIKLWDVNNENEPLQTFGGEDGHVKEVLSVAISKDGKYIVSGSADRTVKLWDVKNENKPLQTFGGGEGHKEKVLSVEISDDGKYIVSGSTDTTVKLWNVENSERPLHTFNGMEPFTSVAISNDGKKIVSGSVDKKIQLWRGADWKDWLTTGCEKMRLNRHFVSTSIDTSQEAAQEAANTCMKYGNWNNSEKAKFLVRQGLALAAEKDGLDEATTKFQQAKQLDPSNVDITKLKTEAKNLEEKCLEEKCLKHNAK
jgi:WD40 repeat protein